MNLKKTIYFSSIHIVKTNNTKKSLSTCQRNWSGYKIMTRVVNLRPWSGWIPALGQELRQWPPWLKNTRQRNMPIRLFVLPSFHRAAAQSELSQLGLKQRGSSERSHEPQQLPGAP